MLLLVCWVLLMFSALNLFFPNAFFALLRVLVDFSVVESVLCLNQWKMFT